MQEHQPDLIVRRVEKDLVAKKVTRNQKLVRISSSRKVTEKEDTEINAKLMKNILLKSRFKKESS